MPSSKVSYDAAEVVNDWRNEAARVHRLRGRSGLKLAIANAYFESDIGRRVGIPEEPVQMCRGLVGRLRLENHELATGGRRRPDISQVT